MLVEGVIQIEEFAPVTNASLRQWKIKEQFLDCKDATSEEVCLVYRNKMKFTQSVKLARSGVTVYGNYIDQGKLSIKLSSPFQRIIMINDADPAMQRQLQVFLSGIGAGIVNTVAHNEYQRLFADKRQRDAAATRMYSENANDSLEPPAKMSKRTDGMDRLVFAHRRALVTIQERNGCLFQPMVRSTASVKTQSTSIEKKQQFDSKYDALLEELLEIDSASQEERISIGSSAVPINLFGSEEMVQVNEPWKRDMMIAVSELDKLSSEQKRVFEMVMNGYNVFFTGPAGCGKSLVLSQQKQALHTGCLQNHVFFTSTTGITAVSLQGCTLWHWLGGNLGSTKESDDTVVSAVVSRIQRNRDTLNRVRQTKLLQIDEISLLASSSLQRLDTVQRKIRGNEQPLGGVQCVFSGDFFQLPPVEGSFAFSSRIWGYLFNKQQQIQQKQVFRQSDNVVVSALNMMRLGRACTSVLNACITRGEQLELIEREMSQQELQVTTERSPHTVQARISTVAAKTGYSMELIATIRDHFINSTRLYTKKSAVTTLNNARLAALPGPQVQQLALDSGHTALLESLPVESSLGLKLHAQVMLVKNLNVHQGLCNGARGVVVGFTTAEQFPIVQFQYQRTPITIKPEQFSIMVAGKVLAERTMIPLCLAWALSIHKAQGATLDSVIVDLKGTFECGQAYVALSRVRDFDRLAILGYTEHCVRANNSV